MQTLFVCMIFSVCFTVAIGSHRVRPAQRFLLDSPELQPGGPVEKGLNSAKDIAGIIESQNFEGFIGKIAGAASSYLSALAPIVGFILSLFPHRPSAEYQLLKKLFTEVDNRFDQIDIRFNTLSRQVGFLSTQVQFAALEANINAVEDEFKYVTKVTNRTGYDSAVRSFLHTYDRSYEDSGSKLFHGIVAGGLTTDAFFQSFAKITKYDRKQTQDLMMGTVNLLMKAARLEIIYGKLNNDPNIELRQTTWESRIAQVRDKMTAMDQDIANNYKSHAESDINDFATTRPSGTLSNKDFANQLYEMLHSKYYWRDWLVLSAAVHGSDKLAMHACDYYNHDNHGRTIGVASVDKKNNIVSVSTHTFSSLNLVRTAALRPNPKETFICWHPQDAFNALPEAMRSQCGTYVAAGIFCVKDADAHIHADSIRFHVYHAHGATTAFVFA